jgi:hypothetical protein
MGHITPAGTGFNNHRQVAIRPLVEEIPADEPTALDLLEQPLAG